MQLSYRWVIIAAGALMTCVGGGRHVLAGRFPAADVACDRLVARRHFQRHDPQFPDHGRSRALSGVPQRPLRRSHRRAVRRRAAWASRLVLASQATSLTAVPAHLRHPGRVRGRRLLCADDRRGHRLVRDQPQPRRLAGFGGHGRGADDDLAVRALADLDLRLAHRHADHRRSGLGAAHPRRAIGAPAAGAGMPRVSRAERPSESGRVGGAGPALAAVLRCWRSPSFSAAPRTPGRSSTW